MRYIVKELTQLSDPRQKWKVRHSLVDILAICIVAVMCGAQTSLEIAEYGRLREEWFGEFLELKHGIPSRLTINRVLGLIDPRQFSALFTVIMQYVQRLSKGGICSIDGKSYMTPRAGGECESPLYMLNAWSNENSMMLGQLRVEEKSNEVTAIPVLLEMLDIRDLTVTIDAIGCQKAIVSQITKQKADYVIGLKENQPTMYHEMRAYAQCCLADESMSEKYTSYTTIEKGHGRIEKREYHLFDDLSWFENRKEWNNLRGFIMVRSTRERMGKRKLALTFLRKAVIPGTEKMSGPLRMWACALDSSVLNNFLFDPYVLPS